MAGLSSDASPASRTETEVTEGVEAPNVAAVEPTDANTENSSGSEATDANTEGSSAPEDKGAKEPVTLLSVIKDAVKREDKPEASPAPEDDQEKPKVEAEGDQKPEADTKDDADLPFHNHPRFKELVEERNALRVPAEQYGQITGFMREHNLEPSEVAEGFEVMALLKSGTAESLGKARDWFVERLDTLNSALGNKLPDDLQERVDSGGLDEETALELAQARATATLQTEHSRAESVKAEQAQTADAAQARSLAMANAVTGWEERIKASDPDYSKKAELVQTTCQAIVSREGKAPTTPEEATALADRALAEVNRQLSAAIPKPKPIAPSPRSSSAITTSAPKSLREAINAAVGL